jgi:hypothetical protein
MSHATPTNVLARTAAGFEDAPGNKSLFMT